MVGKLKRIVLVALHNAPDVIWNNPTRNDASPTQTYLNQEDATRNGGYKKQHETISLHGNIQW